MHSPAATTCSRKRPPSLVARRTRGMGAKADLSNSLVPPSFVDASIMTKEMIRMACNRYSARVIYAIRLLGKVMLVRTYVCICNHPTCTDLSLRRQEGAYVAPMVSPASSVQGTIGPLCPTRGARRCVAFKFRKATITCQEGTKGVSLCWREGVACRGRATTTSITSRTLTRAS